MICFGNLTNFINNKIGLAKACWRRFERQCFLQPLGGNKNSILVLVLNYNSLWKPYSDAIKTWRAISMYSK